MVDAHLMASRKGKKRGEREKKEEEEEEEGRVEIREG
jgi:hypothetical protein